MTTPCPVCKTGGAQAYADKDGYRFVQCGGCGFVYLDPMPTQDELNLIYKNDDTVSAGHYHKARSRRRRAVMKAFAFRRYVKGRKALDVGCGGGFMVDALRIMGADASGIDVSGNAIAYATQRFPRCRFIHASYDELMAHDGRYDVIYSSEVIEHVNNLDAYIGLLRRLTTDNGHVYLTTPDIGSAGVPADVTAWDVFTPPVHVQFFDEATLTRALAGFVFVPVKRYADNKDGLKMLFRKAA